MTKRFLTTAEAADILGNKPTTLAIWRSRGTGPEYIKGRHSVRYTIEAVNEWGAGGWQAQQRIEKTAACHIEQQAKVPRPRGRAWVALREAQLAREPFCRDCGKHGCERVADEVDHIIRLADGGTNAEDNLRSLCRACHATRTRERLTKKR